MKYNGQIEWCECNGCQEFECEKSGWYFWFYNEPYGPFATKGEASTEFQTLRHEIDGGQTI